MLSAKWQPFFLSLTVVSYHRTYVMLLLLTRGLVILLLTRVLMFLHVYIHVV